MAPQLFPQIVFAVVVLCTHASVAIVIVLRHLLCSRTVYSLHEEPVVKTARTATMCAMCPIKLCTFSFVMVVTLASCDVNADVMLRSDDVTDIRSVGLRTTESSTNPVVHATRSLHAWPWWEITGEVLGGIACVGHWIASLYEVFLVHRARASEGRREAAGITLMMTGNVFYVVTVLWRPLTPWLHALPWILARVGLLGINVGMLIQLWRKTRRKGGKSFQDFDANEELLSTARGSDVDDESDVLWDSQWRTRLCTQHTKFSLQKPVTPAYPVMNCLAQGKSPQPHYRTVTYDLLQSTDTSCSRTGEQDTEPEFELNYPHYLPYNPQRDISLPGLTPLTPETRHHRVKQWVEKTSPDDDGHVMVMADDEHAQYRQHSGSFSQPRALSSLPSSRKNSAIF